jgi:predicted porin
MKKSLIAIAILGAISAPAFADTTLYGLVDAFVGQASASGKQSVTLISGGGLATSRLGVKNVEDIGDGWKSLIVLEYRLDNTLNQGVGSGATNGTTSSVAGLTPQSGPARQQVLGLTSADYGTIAAGRLQTTGYDFENTYDPLAGSSVSPLQNVVSGFNIGTTNAHARANNALAYISPKIVGGLTLAVNYALASENVYNTVGAAGATGNLNGNPSSQVSATLVSANYAVDALAVGVVYDKQSGDKNFNVGGVANAGLTLNQTDVALGGSYDFSVVKLFGTYATHKLDDATGVAGNTDKAYSLSAAGAAGPGTLVASFGKLKKDSANNAGVSIDQDVTAYTVAYVYNFSKLTSLYTAYNHLSAGAQGTVAAAAYGTVAGVGDAKASITSLDGGSASIFAIGIKKSF